MVHGGSGDGHGHAYCCLLNVFLRICISLPCGPNLIYVVLWSCTFCLWELVSVYMGGCGGSQGEEYWPYEILVLITWLQSTVNMETWISHKVLRLLKKSQLLTPAGRPLKPPNGEGPRKELMYCEKFVSDLLSTDIAFLLQTGNSDALEERLDTFIACK